MGLDVDPGLHGLTPTTLPATVHPDATVLAELEEPDQAAGSTAAGEPVDGAAVVLAWLATGRSVDPSTFVDLTDADVVDVPTFDTGGQLRVTFDRPLSDTEAAAVRRRITSANAVDESVRTEAEAFMATADPNRDQIAAQVKLLTRLALRLDEPLNPKEGQRG